MAKNKQQNTPNEIRLAAKIMSRIVTPARTAARKNNIKRAAAAWRRKLTRREYGRLYQIKRRYAMRLARLAGQPARSQSISPIHPVNLPKIPL